MCCEQEKHKPVQQSGADSKLEREVVINLDTLNGGRTEHKSD